MAGLWEVVSSADWAIAWDGAGLLALTILTYSLFTGLSFFAQAWWHLLVFRFLAALGIGGEWAVGASLLTETWPRRWRPWIAAVLQTAVNCGAILAGGVVYLLSGYSPRYVFLTGVLPALLVFWICSRVSEPEEWMPPGNDPGTLSRESWTCSAAPFVV